MQFIQRLLAPALTVTLLAASIGVHAAPTLSFSIDGGVAITCSDGATCDMNPIVGVVTFVGAIDAFFVNVTTGISKPVFSGAPQLMDLNSVNIQAPGGAHTLVMMFSDIGFTGVGAIAGAFGGTLNGPGASILAEAFYSADDALFEKDFLLGTIGAFGPGAYSGSFGASDVVGSPFSVTQVLTLTTAASTQMTSYSGDFELTVPEPGSLALIGIALIGVGVAGRRRAG